tara:strand:+ start:807 stop:926 length:120 start_codon:yes stop_codon:yes gene_type:complete
MQPEQVEQDLLVLLEPLVEQEKQIVFQDPLLLTLVVEVV